MNKRYRGIVKKGEGRGRSLGYPTVNIPLTDDSISGIYAARIKVKDDEAPYIAAAFADPARGLLEAFILDFNDDLYGCEIEIELLHKIRDAKKFDDDAALRAAIADDIKNIRAYFKTL